MSETEKCYPCNGTGKYKQKCHTQLSYKQAKSLLEDYERWKEQGKFADTLFVERLNALLRSQAARTAASAPAAIIVGPDGTGMGAGANASKQNTALCDRERVFGPVSDDSIHHGPFPRSSRKGTLGTMTEQAGPPPANASTQNTSAPATYDHDHFESQPCPICRDRAAPTKHGPKK